MEMSKGLGPRRETTGSGRDRCEGQDTRVLPKGNCHLPRWRAGPELPGVQIFFFFFSGEARDLTFFVFNLLIVEFVNISK